MNELNGLVYNRRVTQLELHHSKLHYFDSLITEAPNEVYQLIKKEGGKTLISMS